jgi:hypothetical protein
MSERQGIEIDYCPQCRGVWLDRGELDKIIERSTGENRPQASPGSYKEDYNRHQGKDHRDHDNYHHHKRKGFLHDLFD